MARAKKPNYILELKLNTNESQLALLDKRFRIANGIYNTLVKFVKKQLKRMKENKTYKRNLKEYLYYKELAEKDKANGLTKSENIDKFNVYKEILNDIRLSYSLSEYQFHAFVKKQQQMYKKHIDSNTAQKLATTVWTATSEVMFRNGKDIHFKKFGTLTSLEGKRNTQGIRFLKDKRTLSWNKLNIPVKIRYNDLFALESLENDIKYCRIVRKPFKNGYKYFLQLVIGGYPPQKRINGKFNHGNLRPTSLKASVKGKVGIDIGTSTIAVCSNDKLILDELAKGSKKYEREIFKLQRKLDRSKRANNPTKFNEDGTIKKGVKLNWTRSKNYIKTLFKLKNLYRLKSNYIKLEHNKLANEILSLGNEIYVETMNYKALQKKAKFKKGEEKNSKGKNKRKKRFGKSLNNKAPSTLLTILDNKLGYEGLSLNKINTKTFKASQYNHIEDEYIKKELSDRVNIIEGKLIQRDLYSAFLLMNSKKNLKETDRKLCLKTYDDFKNQHDILINNLINSKEKLPHSFGIKELKKATDKSVA